MAIKVVDMDELVCSITSYKPLHLRFLFRLNFLMSHAYEVIDKRFKEVAQKPFSVVILRDHQDYYFFEFGYAFAKYY